MHVFQFMQSLSFNLFNHVESTPCRLTIQVSKQGILQNCISCKVIQYSCKLEQSDWWLKDRLALSRLQSHLDEWEWRPLWTTLQRKMSQKCWNHNFFMHYNILWISNSSFPMGWFRKQYFRCIFQRYQKKEKGKWIFQQIWNVPNQNKVSLIHSWNIAKSIVKNQSQYFWDMIRAVVCTHRRRNPILQPPWRRRRLRGVVYR